MSPSNKIPKSSLLNDPVKEEVVDTLTNGELVKSMALAKGTAVQHNLLVNAKFNMTRTERRIFLIMLTEIRKDDTDFRVCKVPINRFIDSRSKSKYEEVKRMTLRMAKQVFQQVDDNLQTGKNTPFFEYCDYYPGYVEAKFNTRMRPYLLQLAGHFSMAELEELFKFKSEYSERIYWFIKEFVQRGFQQRYMSLQELLVKLDLELKSAYKKYSNIKSRILEPAMEELKSSDMAFTFKERYQGRSVIGIYFCVARMELATSAARPVLPRKIEASDEPPYLAWLREIGIVKAASLTEIRKLVESPAYPDLDMGYIRYVLDRIKTKDEKKEITTSVSGYAYKAITTMSMLNDYVVSRQPKNRVRTAPAATPLFSLYPDFVAVSENQLLEALSLWQERHIYAEFTYPEFVQYLAQNQSLIPKDDHLLVKKSLFDIPKS